MSFASIRSIAYSSLTAVQLKMQVASSNVANADTDGYTRKTATQTATVTAGVGSGTAVTAITSTVDKYLLKDLTTAATALGAATTTDSYASELGTLFGSVTSSDNSGTSLADMIATLQSDVSSLASTPESDTLGAQVVDALDTVASQLREDSSSIQSMRADADGEIADDAGSVNDALNTIADLNKQIVAAKSRNESTADLEDQRNEALQTVAGYMNVNSYVNSNDEMTISTAGGTTLLDSQVHELSYDNAGTVTADTVFSPVTVGGKDVTANITSGTIGALITQRDDTLPAAQSELDGLAQQLASAVNAVSNTATSVPPPSSLTGTADVAADDAFSATGTVRIAVTDDSGALVSYQDLDLADYSTVGGLVDALNGISGVTASLDSGTLKLSTSSGQGIAIGDIGDSVGSDGQGFSSYFGLNDLLTGTSAADIAVRSDVLSGATNLPTATLDIADNPSVGDSVLTTSSTVANNLYDALTANQTFSAAGTLSARTSSLTDYAGAIVSQVGSAATSAASTLTSKQTAYDTLSTSFSSESGVNLDEETANLSSLEQEYSVSAQLLSVVTSMFDALLQAAQS
ncbi:MAG: flagellar hook-associated protein FlgK [Devosia sp.]|nr:flagellar hook-associated protein FlgK [Devosia sp.]